MAKSVQRARKLRREQTDAECLLWNCLRNDHLKYIFRRQLPIGPYIADFVCLELKLIVEVDGGQHCESKKDAARTKYLNKLGYEVIRFWNNEVEDNLEGVVSTLTLALSQRERGLTTLPSAKEIK
ncbi:MAG: endonuclease domain-containing protein [Alphaproteobacteria bacterium]|nr:MAG: endonuclease domain-containing protein [Alphaproteobacteria bacterium]